MGNLHLRCELAGLVPERLPLGLAGLGREGAGLYRAGVHVEPYEGGSIIGSSEAPSMSAAWPLVVWTPLLSA